MKALIAAIFFLSSNAFFYPQSKGIQGHQLTEKDKDYWQQLLLYKDKDIQNFEESELLKLNELLEAFLSDYEGPYYFSQMKNAQGESRYVLIEGHSAEVTPGKSKGRVQVFTDEGQLIADNEFLIGWRIDIDGARLLKENNIGQPPIEYMTGPDTGGAPVAREYYALRNDQVVLIRLEDKSGRAMSNRYASDGLTIGPLPPDRTADEWESMLLADDPVDVLYTLNWPGGLHSQDDVPLYRDVLRQYVGTDRQLAIVKQVRQRKSVGERLSYLASESNSLWIREAAQLALSKLKPTS